MNNALNKSHEEAVLLNPDYGSGVYRRGIRLTNVGGECRGELLDNMHAMRCSISHEDGIVTAISTEFVRVPVSTCFGAAEPAKELIGTRIDVPFRELFGSGRPLRHCSHMFDLFWLLIRQAGRRDREVERVYEVIIPDQVGSEPQRFQLKRDGDLILDWQVENGAIIAPEQFAGRQILKGFASWANENLSDDLLEGALIMQKGFFVSRSRRYRIDPLEGPIGAAEEVMRGSCWTYTSPRFEMGQRLDSARDLNQPDSLNSFA